MKRVGGGDRRKVTLAVVVSGLRLHQHRVQQAGIAETLKTSVPLKRDAVEFKHLLAGKKDGLLHIPRGTAFTP